MSESIPPKNVHGACNCGAIKVSLDKFPEKCGLCHCANCRASSGSLFSVNMVVTREELTVTGLYKTYIDRELGEGHFMHRSFCGDCGSAVFSTPQANPKIAFLKGGLFVRSGFALPPPGVELFCKRKETWESGFEGAMVFDEYLPAA